MATWTAGSALTNDGVGPSSNTNNRSATLGSSNLPLADKIRKHYTNREQATHSSEDDDDSTTTTRRRISLGKTTATPPAFIKPSGGSAITKTTTERDDNSDGSPSGGSLQPKRFSTGSFPVDVITELVEVTSSFVEITEESPSLTALPTSVTTASSTSTFVLEKGTGASLSKLSMKKKEIKKVKKLEKQEKEQKKKREDDMRKMAQEEEIGDVLLGLKRQLEDVQLTLVRSDQVDEKIQKRASELVKKLVAKGGLFLKSAKALKNNPTQQKYKREFLELEKEFSETTKRFLLDICSTPHHLPPPPPPSTPTAALDSDSSLSLASPPGSPESRSPPTSPPISPRSLNNAPTVNDNSEQTGGSNTNPLRRSRSNTANATRGVTNTLPTTVSTTAVNTATIPTATTTTTTTTRFLSPPRTRADVTAPSSTQSTTSTVLPSSSSSSLPIVPPTAKRSEKDLKKVSQKKGETMARLGELHSLFTTFVEYFQPSTPNSPALYPSAIAPTASNSNNTSPTTPPEIKSLLSLTTTNPTPTHSPYTERLGGGWTLTTSPNTSGSNISSQTKNESSVGSYPLDSSLLVSDEDPESNKKDKSKRASVGRTFGRMVYSSSKKLPDFNSSPSTNTNTNTNTNITINTPASPKPLTKRESDLKKGKGFFTPRSYEKDMETLKMKKQQENFVMSLFLAQRPDKESLIARNIISQSSFGVSLERLLIGEQRVPTFFANVTTYLSSTGFEGQLFDDDESFAPNISALQFSYDAGKTNLFDSSPRVAAGLLKKWLNMLPDPVISPSTLRDDILSMFEAEFCERGNVASSNIFDFLKSTVFKLPTMHRWLLKDLISFLLNVTKSTSNSYNLKSISTIFGPLIFRTVDGPFCKATSVTTMNYIFTNATLLFSESEEDVIYAMKRGRLVVKTATLPKIIVKLIDPNHDHDVNMMNVVLNTYCYYTSTPELLDSLVSQFVARFKQTNTFSYKLRLRILNVLAAWMNLESKKLAKENDNFVCRFLSFCEEATSMSTTPQEKELLNVLKSFFSSDDNHLAHQSSLESVSLEIGNNNSQSTNASLVETVLVQHTVESVAQQITLMDKALFEKIPTQEFLKKNFTKPITSPSYSEMAKKFNHWSQWVSTEIVSRGNIQLRVDTLSKFILVAKYCRELNNFNTAYAIIAGLAQTSVSRLKLTWEKLPKAMQSTYDELKELFNITGNHKNYRDAILQCSPPLVPYLGLYGKFLLAIEDGNPGIVKEKMINLPKYKKLYKQISEIKRYQSKSYPFPFDAEVQKLLLSTPSFRSPLSEEETFKLSLVAEPRNPSPATPSSGSASLAPPSVSTSKAKPIGKRK